MHPAFASYTVLPKDEAPFKTGWFYDELKKITKAVLTHVTQGCPSVPLRSEHLAVYPGFHQWESVGDLQFSQNGEELQAHPNVILLLVKLLVPVKEDTSALPTKQTQEHLTGKRKLPPDDECLPPDSTPSSYHLTRKKIRLEGNSQMEHALMSPLLQVLLQEQRVHPLKQLLTVPRRLCEAFTT
eukprot:Em0019g754a